MNQFDAKTKATPMGHIGLFRCVHKAAYREVCENGRVKFFTDKKDAQIAADEALRKHMNTDLTGYGSPLSTAMSGAEALFKPILRKAGRKPVLVEKVRARA